MKKRISWLVIGVFLVASLLVGGALLTAPPVKEVLAVGPVTLKVLNPRGEIEPRPTLAPTPRVTDLAGKKIGLYWNGKVGTDVFFDTVETLLKEKFPTIKVLRYVGAFDPGDALAAKMAKEVDTVINGVGD